MVCGFGILSSCTAASQKGSAKQIYADCMETFGDREKCEKLVLKQLIGSEKTGESSQVETDRTQASVSLDPEIEKKSKIEIRDQRYLTGTK